MSSKQLRNHPLMPTNVPTAPSEGMHTLGVQPPVCHMQLLYNEQRSNYAECYQLCVTVTQRIELAAVRNNQIGEETEKTLKAIGITYQTYGRRYANSVVNHPDECSNAINSASRDNHCKERES
jgi:hypothetical protein